jgi:hypothetical protein
VGVFEVGPFPAVPAHDGLSHGLSWVVLFAGSQCVHTRRGCWSGFPVVPGDGGDGGSALMTVVGDRENASGLWWKATSATEATPAATARPRSVATMGLDRRWPFTPSCRGASCEGSIGFILTPLCRLHVVFWVLVRAYMPGSLVRGDWVVMVDASARGIARGGLLPTPLRLLTLLFLW